MKLHLANTDGLNLFTAYGEGYVAVNHDRHEGNLILLPDQIIAAWSSSSAETLNESDITTLCALPCEILLLGTGQRLRFPSARLLKPLATARIGVEVMDMQAACRTYNILAAEGRKVAAALLFD